MEKTQKQTLSQAIAVTLIRLRDHFKLSQSELAAKTGLSRQYISMLERQMRMPHVDTLFQLCRGLNVNERDFVLCLQVYITSPEFSNVGYKPPPPVAFLAAERNQAIQARRLVSPLPKRMEEE